VSAFEVNTEVVSEYETVESDVAETDNETELPADTLPILPDAVLQVGAELADKIAVDDLTA
jgi:hypothetical protein